MTQQKSFPKKPCYEDMKALHRAEAAKGALARAVIRNPKKLAKLSLQQSAKPRTALTFVPAALHGNDNPKLHLFIDSQGKERRLKLGKVQVSLREAFAVIMKPLPDDYEQRKQLRDKKANARDVGLAFFEATQDAGAVEGIYPPQAARYFRRIQLARLKQLRAKL